MATVLLILASLALAACGSSSSATTNASATSTNAKASTGGAAGARNRFLAVRECLQKNGVVLPKRKPGQASGGGFLAGGAPQPPKGVTAARYQAALKKCGGLPRGGRFGAGGTNRLKTAAFKKTLAKFASCLRANGVNLPAPNTSGKGPIFNTKGLNVAGAKFKAAQMKCATVLRSGLRASPGRTGTPGAAPPSGAPPSGAPPAGAGAPGGGPPPG